MNKEQLRKELEDAFEAGYEYRTSLIPEIASLYGQAMPDGDTYITTRLAALDDGQEGKGLRWVKASERLPNEPGDYFVILNLSTHIENGCVDFNGERFDSPNVIKWLDERPALPVADGEGEVDWKAKYEKCINIIRRFDAGIIGMYDL